MSRLGMQLMRYIAVTVVAVIAVQEAALRSFWLVHDRQAACRASTTKQPQCVREAMFRYVTTL